MIADPSMSLDCLLPSAANSPSARAPVIPNFQNSEAAVAAVHGTEREVPTRVRSGNEAPEHLDAKELRQWEDRHCAAGMRNPHLHRTAGRDKVMSEVRSCLVKWRHGSSSLQHLSLACGEVASKPPPPEDLVREVRKSVGELLGVPPGEFDRHHEASPLRYEIFQRLITSTDDVDKVVGSWLQDGAPMGISQEVAPGGLFPLRERPPSLNEDELAQAYQYSGNHKSFSEKFEDSESPPTHELIKGYLESGFAEVFNSREEAEAKLGRTYPAPLGNVSKLSAGNKWKHRIIQDLKIAKINDASGTFERGVLPRAIDHGVNVAQFLDRGALGGILILDFSDAFMCVPLHESERPFCCAEVEGMTFKSFGPGLFLVWRVLGFGGRSNPLVYARIASLVSRLSQALYPSDRLRLQLYVDDPVMVAGSTAEEAHEVFDVVLLFWMVLGLKLAWHKGKAIFQCMGRPADPIGWQFPHTWIGIVYYVENMTVYITLTDEFLEGFRRCLVPFLRRRGFAPLRAARSLVGKAARVAHVLPLANPLAASLWAALGGAEKAMEARRREAPRNSVAVQRFFVAASWFQALLDSTGGDVLAPLVRPIYSQPDSLRLPASPHRIEFDASPWGGGAILFHEGRPIEYMELVWDTVICRMLSARIGKSHFQSLWEFVTLLAALIQWGHLSRHALLTVWGDNIGSLTDALKLKGKGAMLIVARELSWRQAKFGWHCVYKHLPKEQNKLADAVSRLSAVPPCPMPTSLASSSAVRRPPPSWQILLRAWLLPGPPGRTS